MIFDFVVVGGGSAGAATAARLAEDPSVSVCLLEAGGQGDGILERVPFFGVAMVASSFNNWQFETVPQTELEGRVLYQPRGKCLGGSSTINAMVYVRGARSDFDNWAAQGCDGWGADDVMPFFLRAEKNQRGRSAFHGGAGPLQVADQRSPHPASLAFTKACEANGIPANDDFNGPSQAGVGLFQVTQFWTRGNRGRRCSTRAAYLTSKPTNLTVVTAARATRIALEGRRAVGVHYRKKGRNEIVLCRREVIVSAGTFGSPHLLLLSGIGPGGALSQQGIDVVHELPGVGQNLQDHLNYTALFRSGDTTLPGLSFRGVAHVLASTARWICDGGGLIASPYAEAGAFFRSSPELVLSDLQLQFVIALDDDHGRKMHGGHGFSCHVCAARPYSRGEVGLTSADPMAPPRIDPRYLSDTRDLDLLVLGAKRMREILFSAPLAPFHTEEVYSPGGTTDAAIAAAIRHRAETSYHPVGTCKMGIDRLAVVDPQLRVHGIAGLRVADASIMPTIISGNTNAASVMIGERAAFFASQSSV
jgi:choline dehydrogenase-like flavoprotein